MRPHRAGLGRKTANFIQSFLSLGRTEFVQICADPTNVHTVVRSCRLRLLRATAPCSHASPTTEQQLLEMEGETAIDGELRSLDFG